jgi:ketosteroid isomerase-like protein
MTGQVHAASSGDSRAAGSAREGYPMDDVKSLVTRFYDTWNERDRNGWLACCNEDITFTGPEG